MTIIHVINGDIKNEKGVANVICNAANEQLMVLGGVAGALGEGCGRAWLQNDGNVFIGELDTLFKMKKVPTGAVAITGAYGMAPTTAILHAVAPACSPPFVRTPNQAKQMRSAYDKVFVASEEYVFKIVSIPFLGAGIFKYPKKESVEIGLVAALAKCPSNEIDVIRFVSTDLDLVDHMEMLLGGPSVTVNSPADVDRILARIPRTSRDIVGNSSNQVDIDRCMQLTLNSTRFRARVDRVLGVPRPPIVRPPPTIMQSFANIFRGADDEKTISLESVKKTFKGDVDVFLVFAESYDLNNIKIDIGPFANTDTHRELIDKLRNTPETESKWALVRLPIAIPSNTRARDILCISRQHKDATIEGFIEILARLFRTARRDPPVKKIGIILPTSCVLNEKWRIVLPIFILLCSWKEGNLTTINGAVLYWSGNDHDVARKILLRERKFGADTITRVLGNIEKLDGIKHLPTAEPGFGYVGASMSQLAVPSDRRQSISTPRRSAVSTKSQRFHSASPSRDTDSPGLSQIFRNLITSDRNPGESSQHQMKFVDHTARTRVTYGTLTDVAEEDGDVLCIPIDNSLILSSNELANHLRERCGEDFQDELTDINLFLNSSKIERERIDGCVFPIHSHNLRRFKMILLMVNVEVKSTSKPTDEEKWKLHSSYKRVMEYAKKADCKRLILTIASAQSLCFRIGDATAIAAASIASIHFALNARSAVTLLRERIFRDTTTATISEPSHGEMFARLVLPEPLKQCEGFDEDLDDLMNKLMEDFLSKSESGGSQASQRNIQDSNEFGGTISIQAIEENNSSLTEGDGRVVYVSVKQELQADITATAGHAYSERLRKWCVEYSALQGWNTQQLGIGANLLTDNYGIEEYGTGISHIVLRKNTAANPAERYIKEACDLIVKSLEMLKGKGATDVVINIPTLFFNDRYAGKIVIISIINYINRQPDAGLMRRYRIVDKAGPALNEMKMWLMNETQLKSREDINNLIDRIMKKESEKQLVRKDDGELSIERGERRRPRMKESLSTDRVRSYKNKFQNEQRNEMDDDNRKEFYHDEYIRKKLRESNTITWEFSEKYKRLKITHKMRREFSNALTLLLLLRDDTDSVDIVRRYKYISKYVVNILQSKRKTRRQRHKLSKVWTSLQKRPELLHQMYSLSIIFKIIRSGKSRQNTISDTVAHYQVLLDTARELMDAGAKVAECEGRKILKQMNRPVLEIEGSSEEENLVRQIGRLRFHIASRNYMGWKVPMVDGIDKLLREWRGVKDVMEDGAVDIAVDVLDPQVPNNDQSDITNQLGVVIDEDEEEENSEIAIERRHGITRTGPDELHFINVHSLPGSQVSSFVDVPDRETRSQHLISIANAKGRAITDDSEADIAMEDNDEREDVHEEQFEEAERVEQVTDINNRLSTVARDVLERAEEEVENIVSQQPDMQDHGPIMPEIILPFTTYIHFCNNGCEELTGNDCRFIIRKVNGYLELLKKEEFVYCTNYFEESQEDEDISALDLIKKMAPCYSGIRSILNRYYKLRSAIRSMRRGHRALKGDRIDQLQLQLNDKMPREIRNIVNRTLSILYRAEQDHFKEDKIREEYADLIKKFTKAMENALEIKICKICNTFTSLNDSQQTTKEKVSEYVRDPKIGEVFSKKCMQSIREKKTNKLRIPEHKYDTREIPAELRDLNWIERLLIQRTRPVINTVHLHDKGGRMTKMKGSRGAMILLPVPTEGTLAHVSNTLPSTANLQIIVSSTYTKTVVCMDRVIKALKMLKQIHPEYANVAIDENFAIPRECIIGGGEGTVELIAKDPSDPTLILHDEITPHVVQDVGGEGKRMKGVAYDHYKLKRNPYAPISLHTTNPDTRAFPWLFPDGQFGFHDVRPKSKDGKDHTERDVAKFQLKYRDRRFASDPSFLAFVHGYLEGKVLLSSIGIRARMAKGNLTTDNFLRLLEDGDADFQISMNTIASALRGRDAFWVDTRRTLQSHISTFGPPTWFITLSPAEADWPDVLRVYQNAYPKENITTKNIRDWIAKDPFFFARQFQNRMTAVWNELLLKEGGPLGTITHFFHRIEYQQRGTQHVHALLWAKDAPTKEATDSEKLSYITKHITARLPSKKKEPELYRIIKTHQMHWKNHSKTCLRTVRYGRKVVKKCRFDFPRPALPAAKFNKAAPDLMSIPGTHRKAYYVARKKGVEQMINDYNPVLSLLWGGNTDVQFVTDLPHIIPYLTSYTSKGESGKSGSALQDALRSATDDRSSFRALHDMLRMRETGSLEMIDLILGHALHRFDSDHVFINTNLQEKRHRMLHKSEDLPEHEQAFKNNAYDNYYPDRPDAMEHLSLFQCLTHFTTDKGGPKEDAPANKYNTDGYHAYGNPYRFQYNIKNRKSQFYDFVSDKRFRSANKLPIPGYQGKEYRRLPKPKIGRFFFPHLDSANEESREDYYRRLCMAFIPWRKEEDLLSAIEGQTFNAFFNMWNHYTEQLKNGTESEQSALEDLERLMNHHTFLLNAQADMFKNREEMRKRMAALEVEEDPEQGDLEVYGRDVDEESMNRNISGMNDGQNEIYELIMNAMDEQDEYKRQLKEIEENVTLNNDEKLKNIDQLEKNDPVRLVVSGTAGTGKSFLINNLADKLTVKYCEQGQSSFRPAVCIAAPTGIAAVQIKGSTIHSLFKIEVQKGPNAPINDMSLDALSNLRVLLSNVRLFVIDEMSMVSNVMLAKIHLRLQEIFSSNELFGGRNILLLGDLMQLPPVKASKIFENLMDFEVMKYFGGGILHTANFFNCYFYRELVENMRQRNDPAFGSIMLNARVQALTDNDVDNLKKCIIDTETGDNIVSMEEASEFYVKKQIAPREDGGDPTILALFATNAEVDQFNRLVMAARKMDIISIHASDSTSVKSRGTDGIARRRDGDKFERPLQRIENDLADSVDVSVRRTNYSRKKGKGGKQAFADDEEDSNITAGLPKMLRVAINGRVMLRRNINPASGLVNGATGTLLDVERDCDNDIEYLIIKFDGIEKKQKIGKLTAVFDVGLDDQIARTQFPIVSAFAATVHKCQGLTLNNVLISTRSFFAPGMAFVAFSRVTTMKGLHLMDFNERKVWCDLSSLKKYNELRESIGLDKYAIPKPRQKKVVVEEPQESASRQTLTGVPMDNKMNDISETPTTRRRRRQVNDDQMDDSELNIKRRPDMDTTVAVSTQLGSHYLSNKRPRTSIRKTLTVKARKLLVDYVSETSSTNSSPRKKKKSRVADTKKFIIGKVLSVIGEIPADAIGIAVEEADPSCITILNQKMGYRFFNRNTDCFANSALNAILCLPSLMEDLEQVPNKNNVIIMLLHAYNQDRENGRIPSKSSHPLRNLFYPQLNVEDDPDEMILKMIECMNVPKIDGEIVKNDFDLNIELIVHCAGSCQITWKSDSISTNMLKIGYIDSNPGTIEDQIKKIAVKESFGDSHRPSGCTTNKPHPTRRVEIVESSLMMPRFLFVSIETQALVNGRDRVNVNIPLTKINAKDMKIFGKRYRMKGAIQYESHANSMDTSEGHYFFWWRMNTGWSIISDRCYKEPARQLPNNCLGMRVLIFEKI